MKKETEIPVEIYAQQTDYDFGIFMQAGKLSKGLACELLNRILEKNLVFIIGRKGIIKITINEREYVLTPSSLVTLLPHQHIEYAYESEDSECYLLFFIRGFIGEYPFILKSYTFEKITTMPLLQLEEKEYDTVLNFYQTIVVQYGRTDHPSRMEIVKAAIFMFIAEANYIYSNQEVSLSFTREEHIVDHFFKLLFLYHRQERSTVFYADKMCLTSKYLSKILKNVTGKSLYSWISEFTVEAAKKLLKSTTMTSAQISEELNFPNPSFFTRYFKKHTGMTPLQFKHINVVEFYKEKKLTT